MGLKGDEVFTPELQDRMGRELLKMRGYDDFIAGKITRDQLQDRLAQEWASIAQSNGRSRYGQPVRTTSAEIRAAIDQASAEAQHLIYFGENPWDPAWR